MITTTYNYSSGTGFLYDASKIGFDGTSAHLLLNNNPGAFSQNYASSAGFTYNSANTEFAGGVMRQINQSPAGLAAYAAWDASLNVNYGIDGLGVTAFNGAAIAGSVLNLTGSTTKYVQLPSTYVMGNQGTIAFIYKPNYTGNPSANQIMYGNIGPNNYFALLHSQSVGHLQLTVTNSTGTAIINAFNFGTWAPVSGTNYTIVLQFDIVNGATKLFINGSQFGGTIATTGSRTASVSAYVGSDGTPADGNANFSISAFALYTTVVGPSSITPLPDFNFNADTISLPIFTYSGVGSILAWLTTAITDTNGPQYTVNGLYWNGSAWVSSNLTFSQSNAAGTISANIATLPLSSTVAIKVYTTNNANIQMSAALFTLNYTGQIYPTSNPYIAPNIPLSLDQISVFTDVFTASGMDGVQFYLLIGSVKYWWNSSAWVVSDGSFAQSNVAMDIQTNAGSLPVGLGAFVTPYALLHSNNGSTTPSLTSLTLTYDYFGQKPTGPNVCEIFGYIIDEQDLPVPGATVSVTNNTTFINQGLVVAQGVRSAITNALGYFSINLTETTTPAVPLLFAVRYPANISNNIGQNAFTFGNALVPNTPSANIATMTFTP